MTDRSLAGWYVVKEYEVDPFTSDSDDGKRIRQVENRALNKLKTKMMATLPL